MVVYQTQGWNNPGLKLANAFGVIKPVGLKLANAFGVIKPVGLELANAFGVTERRYRTAFTESIALELASAGDTSSCLANTRIASR